MAGPRPALNLPDRLCLCARGSQAPAVGPELVRGRRGLDRAQRRVLQHLRAQASRGRRDVDDLRAAGALVAHLPADVQRVVVDEGASPAAPRSATAACRTYFLVLAPLWSLYQLITRVGIICCLALQIVHCTSSSPM